MAGLLVHICSGGKGLEHLHNLSALVSHCLELTDGSLLMGLLTTGSRN